MSYLGDIVEDATIRGSFNTRQANGTPITLAGTPALSVYKDAGTTESTAGVTLTVDFDSRTGHHIFTIDTSADAFYVTGSDYRVVITTGTVDSISVVGVCVGSFSIENRNTKANVTQISGDATAADNAEAFFDGTGYAGTNNVIPTVTTLTNLPAITAGWLTATGIASDAITAAKVASDVGTEIAGSVWDHVDVGFVPDSYGEIVSGMRTSVTSILADTNELQTDWANGGRLDVILDARASQASVDTVYGIVGDILVDTGTTLPATLATLATAANLATVAGYLDTEIAAILEDTGTTIPAQISALNNLSSANVLTQINAALDTAISELSAAAPTATPTLRTGLMLLYMALRNRTTTTASAQTIQNDAGSTIATATLSDDGTTMTKGEFA